LDRTYVDLEQGTTQHCLMHLTNQNEEESRNDALFIKQDFSLEESTFRPTTP